MRSRRFSSTSRRRPNRPRPNDGKRCVDMSTEVEPRDTQPDASDEPPPSEAPGTIPAADVARAHLKGLIEALVFVSEHPLSVNDVAKAAGGADKKLVRVLVDELRADYARRGIHLEEIAGGLLFR